MNDRATHHNTGGVTGGWLILPLSLSLLCAILAVFFWLNNTVVSQENHLIENTQVFVLVLAVAFHVAQRQGMRSQGHNAAAAARLGHLVLATLCLSVMIRELDIDRFGESPLWETTENLIRLFAVGIWLVIGVYAWRQRHEIWHRRRRILLSPTSLLTAGGILLYTVSWLFDKSVVPVAAPPSRLIEESIQLSATLFLFSGSLHPLPAGDSRGTRR